MVKKIGIRREDKNMWERRVPIIPEHMREIAENHGIEFIVQPSGIRIFANNEYAGAGAKIEEDLSSCPVLFAVKEIPKETFQPGHTYVFFSHTIKGQKQNMPMLKHLMELGCTLIDYERVVDSRGRRLIFFGRHAGLAGMVDALWAFGGRCEWEGLNTPFSHIKQAREYRSLDEMKEKIVEVGGEIVSTGLPAAITPFVCGFAGYGHVSNGAQEIYDLLPVAEVSPQNLLEVKRGGKDSGKVYKVVFKEEDMVEPVDPGSGFELQDYYKHPERYRGVFERFVPHLTILMNCIYWDKRYPRLVTEKLVKDMYGKDAPKLKVIGDISCDVDGAVEVTVKATDPGAPVFVYDVKRRAAIDGWKGDGPVVMAVDNLPCEIARESSTDFSLALERFVPAIAAADYSASFDELNLPPEIKRAVIVYKGDLTPDYKYLEGYL